MPSLRPPAAPPNRVTLFLQNHRCVLLLAALIVTLLIYPYLQAGEPKRLILTCFGMVIPLTAILGMSRKRSTIIIGFLLTLPIIYFSALLTPIGTPLPSNPELVSSVAFYVYATTILLLYTLRSDLTLADRISGGIAVYLLIGITFSLLFLLNDRLNPQSLILSIHPTASTQLNLSDTIYFSFSTLTTAGYGDIVPATQKARSLANMESLTGTLYLAIFIARLVNTPPRKRRPLPTDSIEI